MADINSTELFDDDAEQLVKQVTETEERRRWVRWKCYGTTQRRLLDIR
jgi:hypothetical protein